MRAAPATSAQEAGRSLERNRGKQPGCFSLPVSPKRPKVLAPSGLAVMNLSPVFITNPNFPCFQIIFLSGGAIIPAKAQEAPGQDASRGRQGVGRETHGVLQRRPVETGGEWVSVRNGSWHSRKANLVHTLTFT